MFHAVPLQFNVVQCWFTSHLKNQGTQLAACKGQSFGSKQLLSGPHPRWFLWTRNLRWTSNKPTNIPFILPRDLFRFPGQEPRFASFSLLPFLLGALFPCCFTSLLPLFLLLSSSTWQGEPVGWNKIGWGKESAQKTCFARSWGDLTPKHVKLKVLFEWSP